MSIAIFYQERLHVLLSLHGYILISIMDLESSQEMSTILPSSTMDEEEFDVIIDIPELDGLEILPGVPIVVEVCI